MPSSITTQTLGGGFSQDAMKTTNESTESKKLDMNAFLRMFTAQLKYQDPSNPLESYELAAQLAQFTTVERLTEINNNILQEISYLTSINNAQMVQFIGKEVVGTFDTLQVKDGQSSDAQYKLDGPANVLIKITNGEGQQVRTIAMGPQEAGKYEIEWDGRDDAGETVEDGKYHFEIEAVDETGNPIEVKATVSGVVNTFRMEDGLPYLILNDSDGIMLPISSVIEVREPTDA